MDLTGHRLDLGKTGSCALHLAANKEYNVRRIVEVSDIETEMCSIEYFRQNLHNGNYVRFDRAQS
jgi:hypothetical protein